MEHKEQILISTETAEICQKLIKVELERVKTLEHKSRTLKNKLEWASKELSGNYANHENLRSLLKRIMGDG